MTDSNALATCILAIVAAILRDEGMSHEDALAEAQELLRKARQMVESL